MKVFENGETKNSVILYVMEWSFSFSGGPLESRAVWDLCEPILRKLISIKLLPNWHTGFMTTLYLHTIEFRYIHSDIRSNTFALRNFKYDQTLCKLILKERSQGEGEVRMYSFLWFESRWKEWFAARCWLMPRLQSRLCVVFAPFVSVRLPQRTRDNRQTSRSATPHNEPRLHHTGKCICTYTDIAIQAFKHNLSNATAYTQSSHI